MEESIHKQTLMGLIENQITQMLEIMVPIVPLETVLHLWQVIIDKIILQEQQDPTAILMALEAKIIPIQDHTVQILIAITAVVQDLQVAVMAAVAEIVAVAEDRQAAAEGDNITICKL